MRQADTRSQLLTCQYLRGQNLDEKKKQDVVRRRSIDRYMSLPANVSDSDL